MLSFMRGGRKGLEALVFDEILGGGEIRNYGQGAENNPADLCKSLMEEEVEGEKAGCSIWSCLRGGFM